MEARKIKKQLDSKKVKEWLASIKQSEGFLMTKLGVHFNTVRNWLEKGTVPDSQHLLGLAELMGVEPQDLLK